MSADQIQYSEKYYDATYEYRHVILPPDLTKHVPKSHLMTETEWRNLGVQQSPGWVHYMMHAPEPHVILFRRPRQPSTTVTVAAATSTSTSTNSRPNTEQAPPASQPQQSAANNDVSVHG